MSWIFTILYTSVVITCEMDRLMVILSEANIVLEAKQRGGIPEAWFV